MIVPDKSPPATVPQKQRMSAQQVIPYDVSTQITKDYREAAALCSQVNLFGFVDGEAFLTKSGDVGIVSCGGPAQ